MSEPVLSSIEEALAELKQGRMLIVVDDENRENEGDLLMPAECATPEAINFMIRYGRGLVCAPITQERADQLDLPLRSHATLKPCTPPLRSASTPPKMPAPASPPPTAPCV